MASSNTATYKVSHTSPILLTHHGRSSADMQFNHTMFRIKDPKVSIEWYEKVLGMEVSSLSDMTSNRSLTLSTEIL